MNVLLPYSPSTILPTIALEQLKTTLGAIHKLGYVHRDVRPANLLMMNGEILLIDFGFAVKIKGGQGQYAGAYEFASPRVYQQLLAGEVHVHVEPADDLVSAHRTIQAFQLTSVHDQRLGLQKINDDESSALPTTTHLDSCIEQFSDSCPVRVLFVR